MALLLMNSDEGGIHYNYDLHDFLIGDVVSFILAFLSLYSCLCLSVCLFLLMTELPVYALWRDVCNMSAKLT